MACAMMAHMDAWSVEQVARYLEVSPATVRSYAARGQMPAPDGRVGRTPWWHPGTITTWRSPGRGKPGRPVRKVTR